ncbi:hypothetical protein CHRYSEOSP005_31110 [Chryseobacterium sp. Alg-005]|uniref:hypothetical protein n=1 Tax=Chryseobacterium sp. Alg-005 TaxID=3159516 RepID=UPI00355590CB
MERNNIAKLTPEKVVEILKMKGTIVSTEQAEIILIFITTIANIAVNQYLSGRV